MGNMFMDGGGKAFSLLSDRLKSAGAYNMEGLCCSAGALAGEYAYRGCEGQPGQPVWSSDFSPWQVVVDLEAPPGEPGSPSSQYPTFAGALHGAINQSEIGDFQKMSLNARFMGTLLDAKAAITGSTPPLDYISPVFQKLWSVDMVTDLRREVDAISAAHNLGEAGMSIGLGLNLGAFLLGTHHARPEVDIIEPAVIAVNFAGLYSMFPPIGGFSPIQASAQTAPTQVATPAPEARPQRRGGFGRRNAS